MIAPGAAGVGAESTATVWLTKEVIVNSVIPFEYSGNKFRVITGEGGEPWFVAVDVCRVLGIVHTPSALRGLDDDEKSTVHITHSLINQGLSDNSPGTNLNLINEPGLYRLILTSRKAEAKRFRRWVTHDVLTALRKTGRYEVPNTTDRHRIQFPNLLSGFYRGTTLARLTRAERALVGQGVHDFGLTPEQSRVRALSILRDRFGAEPDFLFAGLPIIVPEKTLPKPRKSSKPSLPPAPVTAQPGKPALPYEPPTGARSVVNRFKDDEVLCPTDIGERIGMSAVEVNKMLAELGFQKPAFRRPGHGPNWLPTDKGLPLVVWKSRINNGIEVRFFYWVAKPLMALIAGRLPPTARCGPPKQAGLF